MSDMAGLADLVQQIKSVSDNISTADDATKKAFEEMKKSLASNDEKLGKIETKSADFEKSLNELFKRSGRPGAEQNSPEDIALRKKAIELLAHKHELKVHKKDSAHPFNPSEEEIDEAIMYGKALPAMLNTLDTKTLPLDYQKSLSSFSFGTNQFILEPQMSNQVISCIVDPTDLGGLFSSMTISGPSVKFMIDNQRMALAGWACEAACFANNPQPDLAEGLGELEIKPETLRFVVCSSRDLLEDASINIENWIMGKVSDGMRATINYALLLGDGVGKPLGILNPAAGIPICETSPVTTAGQFTWQDLVMLKYELPMQWIGGGSYLMNQRTFALLMTMSDTSTRPLWAQLPGGAPGFTFCGSPINIVSQMPDVAPGSTPIAFGDWRRTYMIVWRKAVTMQQDPYSAGYCVLYKFEARVGGGVLCPNAARLLRIR